MLSNLGARDLPSQSWPSWDVREGVNQRIHSLEQRLAGDPLVVQWLGPRTSLQGRFSPLVIGTKVPCAMQRWGKSQNSAWLRAYQVLATTVSTRTAKMT